MITSPVFSGKRYALLGLARSGLAAAEALLASGAEVVAWDRQEIAREKLAGRAEMADPLDLDLTGFAGVVVSPGVPLNTHPIASHAAKFGVPVIGDIELFAQARGDLPPHKVVGITGTNGKSTTTALVHHILQVAGIPSLMGGNIGIPIMEQDPLTPNENGVGVYVLELSSYQIDLTRSLDCDVAVLLNITPDHLDRYSDFDAYAASKARLFAMQVAHRSDAAGHGFYGDSDEVTMAIGREAGACQIGQKDWEIDLLADQAAWPSLQGPHNAQNAMAASSAAFATGLVSPQQIADALRSFVGLPHRMEYVATRQGVIFINDSKATNTDSTAPALAAYPPVDGRARLHWIVGGLPKEDGLGACGAFLGNVAAAYTIGEAGPRFAELIEPMAPVERCELLCEAIARASAAAQPGDVVLLSPACASFDQFKDYERRGELFRQIVGALVADVPGEASRIAGAPAT